MFKNGRFEHCLHLSVISGTAADLTVSFSGPEDRGLSPSSASSHKEQHDLDMVTMTTVSLGQQKGGRVSERDRGESRRRVRREGETKQRTGGRREGLPDLDLDLVEVEAQEEERRRKSHRARQKRDGQREKGIWSRSLPRITTQPRETSSHKEKDEERNGVVMERRRHSKITRGQRAREPESEKKDRRNNREEATASHAKDSGSSAPAQTSAFSFLQPMDDDDNDGDDNEHVSDNESATSFSEVSLSAASIATVVWRDDWGVPSPWKQGEAPGPWLKPSSQRLTEVLIGHRLSGQRMAGGLSL